MRGSPTRHWLNALELTSTIPQNRQRILSTVVDENAAKFDSAPALVSDRESLTYRALSERVNRYARWALSQRLAKGETVCLLMSNRPEYLAIWIGITKVGGVVALLNTNLSGPSLAHCINIVAPRHIIAAAELVEQLHSALPDLAHTPEIWTHGGAHESRRIDEMIDEYSGEELSKTEFRPIDIEDLALYIFTSGTTGFPKAAKVNHARIMQWSYWFAGMIEVQSTDRLYGCLPMYHSVGGVMAPGAILAGGGSLFVREKFSATQFWTDVVRWECTLIQYIGELCRYLVHSPQESGEHKVRMAFGNGLSRDVWDEFKNRFGVPMIFEFYAATEGGVSLFNIEGEPGAIGRIPSWLAHRFSPVLVRFDFETEQPLRNERGFCVPCGVDEVGEAIGRFEDKRSHSANRFEGYSSDEASEKRILRDVFRPGDAWVRTGDLMRRDKRGFFYFVDRVGDTFRWKGENVATSEVSEAICAFNGVRQAAVYGVAVPGADGRAGMATLVAEHNLDLCEFRQHLITRLPRYARPLFVRISNHVPVTGTFKHTKTDLVHQGYDPALSPDTVYFDHPEHQRFVPLDARLFGSIQMGLIRL